MTFRVPLITNAIHGGGAYYFLRLIKRHCSLHNIPYAKLDSFFRREGKRISRFTADEIREIQNHSQHIIAHAQ